MSKRLFPFVLVIGNPDSNSNSNSKTQFPITDVIKSKNMELTANPFFKSFLAGSVSGTCSTILFQPLDLIKTRLQNLPAAAAATRRPGPALGPHTATMAISAQSVGMFSITKHVLQTENVFGLWRGMLPSLTRTVPGVGIYFGSLHYLKTHYGEKDGTLSPMKAMMLGISARSFAGGLMIPFTVIKTRFESGIYNYPRMSTALFRIYSQEGLKGLCCGLVPTLIRDAPYSGLYLMFYTQLKQNLVPKQIGDGNLHAALHFSCGITAGILASFVTHPADVVKTKMQLRPDQYRSVVQATADIYHQSGLHGFLRGITPRMLRRTLMSAMSWTVYEQIMRQLGLKNK